MNDHAGVWNPVDSFPIGKLFMEEDFQCGDGTWSESHLSRDPLPGLACERSQA